MRAAIADGNPPPVRIGRTIRIPRRVLESLEQQACATPPSGKPQWQLKRDASGRWRYRKTVRMPNGSTVRLSGTPTLNTKSDAEKAERDHIARTLDPAPKKKEVLTFGEFAKIWWETYPKAAGNRESSRRSTEVHLRKHLIPYIGSVRLDQLRGLVIDRFFAKLKESKDRNKQGVSEKTRKNVRGTLHKMLVCAVEWEYLDVMPKLPRIKVPEPHYDFFNKEESDALLAAARDEQERLYLLFALHTGARVSEQRALEWGDVDFRNRLIVIRRAAVRDEVGPTKSGRERRVPMSTTLERALKRHKHLRSRLVFCDAAGKKLDDWILLGRLHAACRHAGLRRIRWHDLRHSFASQLVMAGTPLRRVQEWLGHSTITMTMRYSHLSPGGDKEFIERLDRPGDQPSTVLTNG